MRTRTVVGALKSPPSAQQDDLLLTLLENSKDHLHGNYNLSLGVTKQSKRELWINVMKRLNSVDNGCQKTAEQWQQVCFLKGFLFYLDE